MTRQPEFAEEYGARERLRFGVSAVAAGAIVALAAKLWLFPWVRAFADSAPCRTVLGIGAADVLWHGLFVGVPLSCAALVAATLGRRGIRILRDGQAPPRGEKVFHRTRIRRGRHAVLAGWLHLGAWAPFAALALWGCLQAAHLSRQAPAAGVACAGGRASHASIPPRAAAIPETSRQPKGRR